VQTSGEEGALYLQEEIGNGPAGKLAVQTQTGWNK
jgi:hypothetical protein